MYEDLAKWDAKVPQDRSKAVRPADGRFLADRFTISEMMGDPVHYNKALWVLAKPFMDLRQDYSRTQPASEPLVR